MIRVPGELLAVAGDEEEGVVRAGPEDEHADDAGVELQIETVADRRGHAPGEPVGGADDDERQQPEDGRAVGDDEEERDDGDRDDEQGEVRAVEG